MEKRRLGRTELEVSVVSFGTCQLRVVPERQAIDTLIRGFELGVNLVHSAPDYEGAEDLVARAIAESGRDVIVATQAYDRQGHRDGPVTHFAQLFEAACERFGSERLELFGIACLDDRELLGENVWGADGMVEFLLAMKASGRIGSIFCTTHGNPAYLRDLIAKDVFDALMIAYNPLGYHLLTVPATPDRCFEDIPRTRTEVLPLAHEHDVGLLVMKPLAGGLLSDGGAFVPRQSLLPQAGVAARDVLRSILTIPEVSTVVVGTASVGEAEENARAGWTPLIDPPEVRERVARRMAALRSSICSRCGECEPSCSQSRPVSWLFRAGYVATQRSETFETWDEIAYFHLHREETAPCAGCPDVSCHCPYGLDIPRDLNAVHESISALRAEGVIRPHDADTVLADRGRFRTRLSELATRVLMIDVSAPRPGATVTPCRAWLENAGDVSWHRNTVEDVALRVIVGRRRVATIGLRHDVHPGERAHFAFDLPEQSRSDQDGYRLRLILERRSGGFGRPRIVVHDSVLEAVT